MKNLTRRDVAKGLAASFVGITAASNCTHGGCVEVVNECLVDQTKAKSLAFELLSGFAGFTDQECESVRMAVVEGREDEEREWFDRFLGPVYASLLYCQFLPVYWQAVRLCFLLNVDGFKLLQLPLEQKKKIIELGRTKSSIEGMIKSGKLNNQEGAVAAVTLLAGG